jgi:hypothetical protein
MEFPGEFFRPVALRPHLSVSLPFSVASTLVVLSEWPRFGVHADKSNRLEVAWTGSLAAALPGMVFSSVHSLLTAPGRRGNRGLVQKKQVSREL